MATDFATLCNEQIALADSRLAELDAQRGELSDAFELCRAVGTMKVAREIEKRLLALEGEVAHLTVRRSAWTAAVEHGYITSSAIRAGFLQGAII
jgi:hypothetical protein